MGLTRETLRVPILVPKLISWAAGDRCLSDKIETPDYFERSQDRAREEYLRASRAQEISAREALEKLLDQSFEEKSEAEYKAEQAEKKVKRIQVIVQRLKRTISTLAFAFLALIAVIGILLYSGVIVIVGV